MHAPHISFCAALDLGQPDQKRQNLTPRQTEILRTYEEAGGNASEVARKLGIRRSAVRQTIHHCKVKGIRPRLWLAILDSKAQCAHKIFHERKDATTDELHCHAFRGAKSCTGRDGADTS